MIRKSKVTSHRTKFQSGAFLPVAQCHQSKEYKDSSDTPNEHNDHEYGVAVGCLHCCCNGVQALQKEKANGNMGRAEALGVHATCRVPRVTDPLFAEEGRPSVRSRPFVRSCGGRCGCGRGRRQSSMFDGSARHLTDRQQVWRKDRRREREREKRRKI